VTTSTDILTAKRHRALDERALATIFTEARTANGFLPEPVPAALLERLIELTELGPTSANGSPARFVFVTSPAAKEKLLAAVMAGNVEKVRQAPVTAIVASDTAFHEHLPRLFPHNPAFKNMFVGDDNRTLRETFAFRNGTLQGAYLMIAARALGLDCGPMSGFDNKAVDQAFFAGTTYESNWLVNLGYADDSLTKERLPRFAFADVATIV
jgi:3-hydroxypropanoate dehydrogenase